MRTARLTSLVFSNLNRSRSHFLLASVGIVVGIATFAFFIALGIGVRRVVLGKIFPLDQLEVVPKSLDVDVGPLRLGMGSGVLDEAKVDELRELPGVDEVYPKMRLTVPSTAAGGQSILGTNLRFELIGDGINPALVGDDVAPGFAFKDFVDEDAAAGERCSSDRECGEHKYCGYPFGTFLDPRTEQPVDEQGQPLTVDRICRSHIPILASHHVLELYNGAIARAHGFPKLNPKAIMGLSGELNIGASMVGASQKDRVLAERGMLVGFSNKAITLGITMPIGYVQRFNVAFGSEVDANRFHSAILMVPSKDRVAEVARGVEQANLQVADTGAEEAALLIAIFIAVFGLVSAVIVGIAAVNIMHVFFMLVYERQHEIGIMRAVGASRGDVLAIVLGEAAVLGAAAGAVGLLLARGTASVFNLLSARYIPDFPYKPETYFAFPWWLVMAALLFAVGFCVLGALLPARRAAKMEPARVLSSH